MIRRPTRVPGTIALVALLLLGSNFTNASTALAQATPGPPRFDIPSPRDCTIAPRPEPLFPPGVGQRTAATPAPIVTASPAPFSPPEGETADAETIAAVRATVREAVACRNAGDFLRAYALFTQAMIVSLLGGPASIDVTIRSAIAEKSPPVPRADRLAIIAVDDISLLPDGRIGALVTTRNAQRAYRDYLVFAQNPSTGRWLIDEAKPLP
jgi:hypothetical protein